MPDKVIDLGECRTGYTSDITDDGSDDTFNHVLQWESTNTNPNIVETVVDSEVVLNQDYDSGTSLVDNGNNTFTYSGMFGVETFPNVSMTFRTDFVNNVDKTIIGWPPSDPRAKDVYSFSLDPTGTKNINIGIEFKVKATNNGVPITTSPYVYDSELDEYVRTDKFIYIKEAINKTGLIFGSELNKFINGEELSISDLPTIEPEPSETTMSNLWGLYGYPSVAYSLRSLTGDQTNVARVRRSTGGEEDFTADQIANGELVSWVNGNGSGASGFVSIWYDQSGNGYDARERVFDYQPLIVENGSIVTDTDDKVAIKGTAARLRLGHFPLDGESPREMLSADGTHSLFIVCDLPDQTAGNANYNYISRFLSTSTPPANKRPRVYLGKTTGELVLAAEADPSKVKVSSSDAQSAQLVTDIVNPSGTTKAEKHSVYIDGAFNAEQPYGNTWIPDGNTSLSEDSRLFSIGETTVDTYISELIYYPSDQSAIRTDIETNIRNHYNI